MKDRCLKKNNGSVTIFLALMILPMLIFFLLIIDGIRLSAAKSMASDAGDLAMDGAMADYDRMLKEAYGLYAVSNFGTFSQDINHYYLANLSPQDAGSGSSLLPKMSADVKCGVFSNSRLSEDVVFTSQIMDFMKYFSPALSESYAYMTVGMKTQKASVQVILDKCRYDLYLYKLASGMVEPTANAGMQLRSYYESWKTDVTMLQLPEDLRSAMQASLANSPGAVDMTLITGTEEEEPEADGDASAEGDGTAEGGEPAEGDGTVEGDDAAAEEDEAATQEAQKAEQLRSAAEQSLRNNVSYVNGHSFYQIPFSEIIDPISPELAPAAVRCVANDQDDYVTMLESFLTSLEAISDVYENYDLVEAMIRDGWSQECMIAEYAGWMFSSFISNHASLSGRAFNNGTIQSKYYYTEIEYILCGAGTMQENQDTVHCMLLNYCFLCCVMENFAVGTEKQAEAFADAKALAAGNELQIPMLQDLCLMGISAKDACTKKADINNPETGVQVFKLYRGDGYQKMSYIAYIRMLLMYYVSEHKDVYLQRMRKLIEENMQYNGETDFSFEHCYTAFAMDADVTVDSILYPTQSFHYYTEGGF